MIPFIPSLLLLLLLAAPALLTPSTSHELQVRGTRDTKEDSIKMVISEGCVTQGDSPDASQGSKEINLTPGSPLVLTHKIKLIPSGSGSGSTSCGCEVDLAALRERLERLEREVSSLREKCGGAEGGCCTSKESKGAGCSIKPEVDECPNECSDQGRCIDGKCVCFPGFNGHDCSKSNCPGNCNNNGRCLNGQCVCDPGFTGPDCSLRGCPNNCNSRGRCVNGKCVCEAEFTGPSCSEETCPRNCNNKGRCVNGQCVCNPGFTGPDCSKKACPSNCSDRGRCVNGKCVCDSGFTGPRCSDKSCPENCNNRGRCVDGQCVCNDGFSGLDCSERRCLNDCSDHGKCVNGKCVCDIGFTGTDCSEAACLGNCNNRGRCVDGQCVCNDGFSGVDCSEKTCPNDCSDRGRCVNGECVCNIGFIGTDCSEAACLGNCNNRGRCVDGQCVCNDGFSGPDCSERTCPNDCSDRGRCVNGKCTCDIGFTGTDCSEAACLGNCNNRGRCVDGQCVCNDGFRGLDCSERTCANECSERGRCVNGKCVCNSGFTGADCSEESCPGNCNNRGRCIKGQCVCKGGFTGVDCTEKVCPKNCSNHGKCVNGKCVCDVGFSGVICAAKSCPANCNNKGRCIKGKCVCRQQFTGPDCSQCQEGMTGPNCDTVMSGVSQLSTRDITETSVTLVWTPPAVQYDTYYITFTSQKEGDQQINVQVEGGLSTFTQTGLAAGQDYTVSITGELEGRKGAETSAEFMTLISGPTDLRVVKTTSMSAVVQWEQSQGEIDRYHLTVTPNSGAGKSQEMTVPAGQNSAHIQQLEAGRLYDIVLVAEKGTSQSEPATTQVTPGKTIPRDTMAALTLVPGEDVGDRHLKFNTPAEVEVLDQQRRSEDGKEADSVKVGGINGSDKDWTSVTARTKPLVRKEAMNDTRPSVAERSILYRKPIASGSFRFNRTRPVPGIRKFGPGPQKKPPMKNKAPLVPKKRKPDVPLITDMTMRHPSNKAPSINSENDKKPTIMSETLDTNRQSSPDEPTAAIRSKEQPDIGAAGPGNSTAAEVSSELIGTVQSRDKKCMNKIKLTHFRFPQGRTSGCKGDGTVLEEEKMGSDQGSSETDDLKLSSAETDLNYSPDSLHKLMTDTYNDLNTTKFSVYLSKPSSISVNGERAMKQILSGLKPLSPSSPESSHLLPSQSSSSSQSSTSSSSLAQSITPSPSHSSDEHSSLLELSPSTITLHSLAPSSSTVAPPSSPMLLISPSLSPSPSSLPSLSPSSSVLSNSDKSGPVGISELDVDSKRLTDSSPENTKLPLSGKGGAPLFHRRPAFVRRLRPNFGLSKSKPHINWRAPPNSTAHFNLSPRGEAEARHTPTSELSSLPSSSVSEDSYSVKVHVPVWETSAEKDRATPTFSRVEQTQKKMQTERVRIPVRRPSQKGEYLLRRPNFGPVQNQTRPNLRLPPPSRPLNPVPEIRREHISSTEEPVKSSLPVSKEPYLAEGPRPVVTENEDRIETKMSTDFNQTLNGSGTPSSHHPATKLSYIRRLRYERYFQNQSRTNLRPPQHPHRVPMRKPFPTRKLNGSIIGGVLRHENDSAHDIPDTQSGGQVTPMITQGAQIRQSEEQDTPAVIPSSQTDDVSARLQFNKAEGGISAPMQTNNSMTEEASAPDSNSDTHEVDAGKNISIINPGGQTVKQTSSDVRNRAPIPATLPKTQSPTRRVTAPHPTQIRHYNSGSKIREKKINNTGKRLFNPKPEETKSIDSKPHMESDGAVTREPLDHVGVTNRTSNGFTLLWDSPKEKYKNFVVTSKVSEKEGGQVEVKHKPTKETESEKRNREDENRLPESVSTKGPSSTKAKPVTGSDKTFKKILPGSARLFQFENLPPQTEYTVTLLGKGRGLLSRLHKLVISTELKGCGALENCPEPPSNIVLSDVTENSLTVSWTKPNTPISGFKVTYTHAEEGEPVSMSVGSDTSTLDLSQLSPGSSYEVSVISILGLDESDAIKDFVMTLPDPPTKLQVLNVTDTNALLLWRPALGTVDKYAIVYGSGTDSELRITVSGNAAEHQLSGLEGSTTYTVTITSQLGSLESSAASTSFTTTEAPGGGEDSPHDLRVNNVSPRTALLSWKPPSNPASSYRLTYQTDGEEMKEVTVDASVTEYNLTRLHPGSKYTVQLQAEEGGQYTAAISTDFTTGTLRFPFPTDCSQELLNGVRMSGEVEIFPQGKRGTPLMVYCDMETDGGGWTVFQRRKDGSVDFFRGWKDYTEGFGSLSGEFWLGLDNLHNLTAMTRMSLRVDLRDKDEAVYAKYSRFEVLKRNYKLNVGGYSGTAGDSLSYHNQRIFSTKDRDPMPFITRCAMSYRGGWWYKNCHEANLNGLYGTNDNHQGVIWTTWRGKQFSIPFTEMKMRPAAFSPPTRG